MEHTKHDATQAYRTWVWYVPASVPELPPKKEASRVFCWCRTTGHLFPAWTSNLGAPLLTQENRMKHLAQTLPDVRHHVQDKENRDAGKREAKSRFNKCLREVCRMYWKHQTLVKTR